MKSDKRSSRSPSVAGETAATPAFSTRQRTAAQIGNSALGRVVQAKLDTHQDLRLWLRSSSGEVLQDEESLIAWARGSHLSEELAILQVESSNLFSGSTEARKAAVQILRRAFRQRSLEDRRKDYDSQISQELQDYAEYEDMVRYSREQAQKRGHRERWIAGAGDLKENVLPEVSGARLDKSNKVTFETYDATGERVTLQFDTPRAFDVSATATLAKVRKRAHEVQEDVTELIRLDRKVVADTLAHATALQRVGLALPGIHLGFSRDALDLGRLATHHAAYAVKVADEQMKAFAQGLSVSGTQVNGVLRALFEAKHLLHAMVRTRESDDEATLGRLQNYSKVGDYATMVLPPPMQVALSAIKNAGMRASNMHADPNAEFGWGGFLWQTGVSIVATKVQGRLLGPSPSFGRAFATNVGVAQTSKVLSTGKISQFTEMEPLELVFAGYGAAHASGAGARPRAPGEPVAPTAPTAPKVPTERASGIADRQSSRVDDKPKTPVPHQPPALRPPTARPEGMKGPDETGTASGTVENDVRLPSKVRNDTRKLAKALRPGNDPTRVSRKRIVRVLLGRGGIREVTTLLLGRVEQRLGLKPGTLRGVHVKFVAKGSDEGAADAQGWVDPNEPHVLYLVLDNTSGAAVTDAAPGEPVGVYSRGGKQPTAVGEAGATTAHEIDHVFTDLGHTRAAELSAMLREEKLFPTGRSVADIKRRIDRLYGELPTGDPHWWDDGHAAKPADAKEDTDVVEIDLTADEPEEK